MNAITKKRIRTRMDKMDVSLSQLSRLTDIPKTTLHRYLDDPSTIPLDRLEVMAKHLKVSPEYLMGWKNTDTRETLLNKFKLFENPVSAGQGTWIDEGTEYNYIEIEHPPVNADFALKVRGDSMSPKYNDGDVVFIKSLTLLEPGEVGVFLINGEGYLKQWQGNMLLSLNRDYSPIYIEENDEFMMIGKVVGKLDQE